MGRWQTRLTVVAVLTMAAVADGQDRTAPGGPTHHIYITAVDKGGMPVKDLAPADVKDMDGDDYLHHAGGEDADRDRRQACCL